VPQRKQRNTGLKTGHYTAAGKDAGATWTETTESRRDTQRASMCILDVYTLVEG